MVHCSAGVPRCTKGLPCCLRTKFSRHLLSIPLCASRYSMRLPYTASVQERCCRLPGLAKHQHLLLLYCSHVAYMQGPAGPEGTWALKGLCLWESSGSGFVQAS